MFVADKVLIGVGFDAAKAGLASLAAGGGLVGASEAAYREGMTGLVWPTAPGPRPVKAGLAGVRFRDLAESNDGVGLALRWEAIGPDGGLFPVLDADIKLTWAGEHATVVTVAGTYRPPAQLAAAGLDRVIVHPVATETIRIFVLRVADAIGLLPQAWPDREGRQ